MNVMIYEQSDKLREEIKRGISEFNKISYVNVYEECNRDNLESMIKSINPDIYIVDLNTEKKADIDVIKTFFEPYHTIAIAKYLSDEDLENLMNIDIFCVLGKPIDINFLKISLNTLIQIVEYKKINEIHNVILDTELGRFINLLDEGIGNAGKECN